MQSLTHLLKKWKLDKVIELITRQSFYFESHYRTLCVLDLYTLTVVGGSRDGDCGDKQTHAAVSLVPRRALLRRFDSTG